MSDDSIDTDPLNSIEPGSLETSRRQFLTLTGTSLAALSALAAGCSDASEQVSTVGAVNAAAKLAAPTAPFDSIRDYLIALEANGLLLRVPRIDQDRYQTTALVYRSADRFGLFNAPALMFENLKINGKWMEGPLIANAQGHITTDCILAGVEAAPEDRFASYRKAKAHWTKMLESNDGVFPEIPPLEVERDQAPCKEVELTGDEVNLFDFAAI